MMRATLMRSLSALALLASALPATAQVAAPETMTPADGYRLGANDEIEVTIFGSGQSQSVKTRIKEDGTVTLPFLGAVMVRDATARELSVRLASQLRSGGFFTKPVVNVDVTQYVSNSATVFGEVATPGLYPLDRPLNIGMMVARAGGSRAGGADFGLLKRSGDATEHRIMFDRLTGEWSSSTPVLPGDTLYVPVAPQIFVYGQVNAPGAFGVKSGTTVRQVLARAGGTTLAGTQNKITLYRDGKKIKKINLESEVAAGDTLFVNERLF